MHLHSYLLVKAKQHTNMPRGQRNMQSNEEISTPTSFIAQTHGRLEAWFESHEDKPQVFLIKITCK